MTERFKVIPSVFIAVTRENEVLLQSRQNTGFYDGFYDLPSGHVEEDEGLIDAAIRELHEETGIITGRSALSLFHICQDFETPGKPYLYSFFRTDDWSGKPRVGEPDKIISVGFFSLDKLPKNTTPHVITALADITAKKVGLSVIN